MLCATATQAVRTPPAPPPPHLTPPVRWHPDPDRPPPRPAAPGRPRHTTQPTAAPACASRRRVGEEAGVGPCAGAAAVRSSSPDDGEQKTPLPTTVWGKSSSAPWFSIPEQRSRGKGHRLRRRHISHAHPPFFGEYRCSMTTSTLMPWRWCLAVPQNLAPHVAQRCKPPWAWPSPARSGRWPSRAHRRRREQHAPPSRHAD